MVYDVCIYIYIYISHVYRWWHMPYITIYCNMVDEWHAHIFISLMPHIGRSGLMRGIPFSYFVWHNHSKTINITTLDSFRISIMIMFFVFQGSRGFTSGSCVSCVDCQPTSRNCWSFSDIKWWDALTSHEFGISGRKLL